MKSTAMYRSICVYMLQGRNNLKVLELAKLVELGHRFVREHLLRSCNSACEQERNDSGTLSAAYTLQFARKKAFA
jgi:hypothetical protein